jgi:hypothetical protein
MQKDTKAVDALLTRLLAERARLIRLLAERTRLMRLLAKEEAKHAARIKARRSKSDGDGIDPCR